MRIIAILVLVFGAALAGGGVYVASKHFEQMELLAQEAKPEGPKTVKVIVAKEQLNYGMEIKPNRHLRWVDWPEASLPEGVFTEAEALLGENLGDGKWSESRFVVRQMEPGEPILESKITGFGEEQRMAMKLGEGKRAFAIKIDAVSGVAGFVTPGDRVDIFMTRSQGRNLESVVILENILVIAVDQQTNTQTNSATVGRTATVEVTPEQAQRLALAQQVGRLSLTLRGYGEEETVEAGPDDPRPASRPRTVDVRDLLGEERKQRTGTSVTVRKGGAISDSVVFE